MNEMVKIRNGHVITTSREVASYFKRRHHDVLRLIEDRLGVPPEFKERNFTPVEYKSANNQMRPMFEMTRDGFVILAMGFTGVEAMKFKIAYLTAFNAMEKAIRSRGDTDTLLLRSAILRSNKTWGKIKRYHEMGLNQSEIGVLVKRATSTISRDVREMRACGLLNPTTRIKSIQLQMFSRGGA